MSDQQTLDCDSVAPYLSAFADGELAESLRADVAAHVRTCGECDARLAHIRAVDQLVAQLPRTTPSAGHFERTLAAATHSVSADPRTVTREALPGATGADARRRLREFIAPEPSREEGQTSTPVWRRVRRPWIAAAIPLVAALLLVSLAVTLFNHFPSLPHQGTASQPTPSANGSLEQTRTALNAVASQLAFAPVAPTYLPAGASAPNVRVGPAEQVEVNSRYLDITWTFASGPVQTLHLRELPSGLSFYGYMPASSSSGALAWSLPNHPAWEALSPVTCASCLSVGEARNKLQLALDAQPRGGASPSAVAAWLRLVSLSLDAPYLPLGVTLAPPSASLALQYHALVKDGSGLEWKWTVTTVGSLGSQQNATARGKNGVNVTEIVNQGKIARRDNTNSIYQLVSTIQGSVQPPSGVTQTLFAANAFVSTGELWNLGKQTVTLPDGHARSVYVLYRVNAAQPEYVYADATTGQVIAQVVDVTSKTHPGGINGVQTYVSTAACPPYSVTYTSIQYVALSSLPASYFDTAKPNGWNTGTVAPAFSCQG